MEAHAKYLQSQIMTATPEKLVLILYDATIRFISQAKSEVELDRISEANESLCKAQAIIAELMSSLDMTYGLIAENLYEIYQFVYDKLVEANVNKDIKVLIEITPLLEELREGWRECFSKALGERKQTFSAVK